MWGTEKMALLGLLIVAMLCGDLHPVGARTKSAETGTITVIGEGRVSAAPDVARINVGVTVDAATVREAMRENRRIMEQVLDALEKTGIAEKDIATSHYSIHHEQPRPQGPGSDERGEKKFHVSNMVRATIRDLGRIDAVLDAATRAGANQVWGVQLVVDDPERFVSQARRLAVEQARTKAAELASLHGRGLGKMVAVSELVDGVPGVRAVMESAGGGPIRPGEQEVVIRLQVVYAIE